MPPDPELAVAERVFAELQARFPHLRFERTADPHIDLGYDLPPQPDLAFHVNINLQGDELHLAVEDGFWCEWFPCDKPKVEARYLDAVEGLLSGRYRIVEMRQRGSPVWARLERPGRWGWTHVASWGRGYFPLPWGRKKRVLQNHVSTAA